MTAAVMAAAMPAKNLRRFIISSAVFAVGLIHFAHVPAVNPAPEIGHDSDDYAQSEDPNHFWCAGIHCLQFASRRITAALYS
jgi:hypothetical protein